MRSSEGIYATSAAPAFGAPMMKKVDGAIQIKSPNQK
jgi:hypothetical protein